MKALDYLEMLALLKKTMYYIVKHLMKVLVGAILHKNSFPQIEYYVKAPFFLLIF